MATEERTQAGALTALAADAARFEFFQAVQLLQRLHPDRPPVGAAGDPEREVVQFRAHIGFLFPPSEVRSLTLAEMPGQPHRLVVNHLGLANPVVPGSLPDWYAVLLLKDEREGQGALRDFLALLDHRLIGLYYRAWARHHLPACSDAGADGPLARLLRALLGVGTRSLAARMRTDPRVLIRHAAHLMRPVPTADGLAAVLTAHFGVRFAVQPFQARAVRLADADCYRLGGGGRLGSDLVIGSLVLTAQQRFRLCAGPVTRAQFDALLPGGDMFAALVDLVRIAVGMEFDWDLQLVLRKQDVPVLQLGGGDDGGSRLGVASWLGQRLRGGDAVDTIIPASDLEWTPS